MQDFTKFYSNEPFVVFEGKNTDQSSSVIARDVMLPHPVETRRFRLHVIESAQNVDLKMDLLGMTLKERYDLNPFLDEALVPYGEH